MLHEKCAVVTGASRGIGRAIAKELASRGMHVVINYASNMAEAESLRDEIAREGFPESMVFQANVADFVQAEALIAAAQERFGGVHVLVNNAGITRDKLIMQMREEDYDSVLDINLKGAFNCIRHASKRMMRQKFGKIVNITSVAGVTGNAGQANYSAAKAGLIGLTKAAAKEMAPWGVTVNAVAPGLVETDMAGSIPQAALEKLLENTPMKRMGKPEEIAALVWFLCQDAAYITGQVIHVDGGLAM